MASVVWELVIGCVDVLDTHVFVQLCDVLGFFSDVMCFPPRAQSVQWYSGKINQ